MTEYKVDERYGKVAAHVLLYPRTGRTHQLRVHLTSLGHPILGDPTYGGRKVCAIEEVEIPRVMLHARTLGFMHPTKGERQEFTRPFPNDMEPMQPPPAQEQPEQQASQPERADGSRAKGALRGAAAGAVIGEVADDDAGKGAAIGATAGVLAGGRRSRMAQSQQQEKAAQEAQASAEQAKAAQKELADAFKRGMTVCLEARGYTVK